MADDGSHGLPSIVGADNLYHQAIFMNHVSLKVTRAVQCAADDQTLRSLAVEVAPHRDQVAGLEFDDGILVCGGVEPADLCQVEICRGYVVSLWGSGTRRLVLIWDFRRLARIR
jgi:hypothetical protein